MAFGRVRRLALGRMEAAALAAVLVALVVVADYYYPYYSPYQLTTSIVLLFQLLRNKVLKSIEFWHVSMLFCLANDIH